MTVQFYQATDGAEVRSPDAARIAQAIEDALAGLTDAKKIGKDDRVLFYFSGQKLMRTAVTASAATGVT